MYHSSIIGAVELNCDLLVILTEPMRLAYIATFTHLLQVIVETQTLIMQLPRYVLLLSGTCPINLFAFVGLMVLRIMNISTQALSFDSKPNLFYSQRHLFFFIQLYVMVVAHVSQESCMLLLLLIILLDFLQPLTKGAWITFVQKLVIMLSKLSLRSQIVFSLNSAFLDPAEDFLSRFRYSASSILAHFFHGLLNHYSLSAT